MNTLVEAIVKITSSKDIPINNNSIKNILLDIFSNRTRISTNNGSS